MGKNRCNVQLKYTDIPDTTDTLIHLVSVVSVISVNIQVSFWLITCGANEFKKMKVRNRQISNNKE